MLQAALIEVLGDHIKQSGSRVSPESLRFDFTHPEALKTSELQKIENLVNQKITEGLAVTAKQMTKDEAVSKGAMALFGEKYGDTVRVLEMGDFSLELCGGLHVTHTKDIGVFTITNETSLASGVRRIEAKTSFAAYEYLSSRSQTLQKIERKLSTDSSKLVANIESLQNDLKAKNKEIKKLQDQAQAAKAKDILDNVEKFENGIGLVTVDLKGTSAKEFRGFSDKFVDQNKEDVLLLYSIDGDKVSYLLRTHKGSGIKSADIMKRAQEHISGRGGGKPDMGQGSGEAQNFQKFIDSVKEQIKSL